MTIDDVVAREAIRDLTARYNAYSDAGRFEPLFELFAPDAVMETGDAGAEPARYEGLEEVKRIFTSARETLQGQSSGGRPHVRHFTATHQIDLVDAGHATGRLYFAVLTANGLDHWGRYLDEYVRSEERWQFRTRRVLIDGRTSTSQWHSTPQSP